MIGDTIKAEVEDEPVISGADIDAQWRDCEFCLSFDTGPVQRRPSDYAPGEGHPIDPEGPFAHVVQLDDGWLAAWNQRMHDEEHPPYLLCPFHARNEQVPRPEGFTRVGDFEVNLQEFDYIGTRSPNIVMFKHAVTKRYLNLSERGGRVVWCDYQTSVGVVDRLVAAGLRPARRS